MVLEIIEFIGDNLLKRNPYIDVFGANVIKLGKDGAIVNFVGEEKQDFSPTDIMGIGAYARLDGNISYAEDSQRQTACAPRIIGTAKFRLVIFSINQVKKIHPYKLENKITSDLMRIGFGGYTGKEKFIKLMVNGSNLNFLDNFKQEIGKDYNIGADATIIALNSTLTWVASKDECIDDCNVFIDEAKC